MNVYAPIRRTVTVEMSPEGEILIPEAIRRVAGLYPGSDIVIGITGPGEATITTRMHAKRFNEKAEARETRLRHAVADVAGAYSTGQSTADVMEELRGGSPA